MVLPKIHPILYTNSNYTSAPKNYKGSKTPPQLSKVHLHHSKALLFLSFEKTHIRARGVTFQTLCLLLRAPLFQLNINSLGDLDIAQETPNHLKMSHHSLVTNLQCIKIWSTSSPVSLHRKHQLRQTTFCFLRFSAGKITHSSS